MVRAPCIAEGGVSVDWVCFTHLDQTSTSLRLLSGKYGSPVNISDSSVFFATFQSLKKGNIFWDLSPVELLSPCGRLLLCGVTVVMCEEYEWSAELFRKVVKYVHMYLYILMFKSICKSTLRCVNVCTQI